MSRLRLKLDVKNQHSHFQHSHSGLVLKEGRGTEEVLCGAHKHPASQSLHLLRADTHQFPPTATNQAQCPYSKKLTEFQPSQ